jgi:AraC family transcriptional regulator of adaptative response/methylated-DNA-[protein]-cysteine methyltransferase
VEFFPTAREALSSGYRPCLRCRPLEPLGAAPEWLRSLLVEVEEDPARRWTDAELEERGLHPDRVRRWFQEAHGMTFHAFCRARRLGDAFRQIRVGSSVTDAAFDHGYESLSGFQEAFRKLFDQPPGRAVEEGEALFTAQISTPLGPMVACATDEKLVLLEFADRRMLEAQLRRIHRRLKVRAVPGRSRPLGGIEAELAAYFAGELRELETPFEQPGSDFQRRVWDALLEIPYGETVTYGEVAARIAPASHPRAVARAVGMNALAIVVPCHRVVGADGSLTGYGGGLWRKERLLGLETSS